MLDSLTRRQFPIALASTAGVTRLVMASEPEPARDYPAPAFSPSSKTPPLGTTLVRDFIVFAHYDLDMTRKLLDREPRLVAATVDWGGGDWESALGGAAHMGRADIAEFLLNRGARMDLFAAAMLGHLDIVRGMLQAFPALIDAPGPHGFSLHWHAKAGKKPAEAVYEYLLSLKPEPPVPQKKPS